MLPDAPDPYRLALNRLTFGARDLDVAYARQVGLSDWMMEQLDAPPGDDPDLAVHLANQRMRIQYNAPAENDTRGRWTATDEMRPLNYIGASTGTLWAVATQSGTTFSFTERFRIRQELLAATWIRNTHSRYQLREFMTDFWHNHFNIGKNENEIATALLPVYDRDAIRPHVFGNFREMLEANATSTSMLIYLDNYVSTAATPNENYAREIMELHTLGGGAYLGINGNDVPLTVTEGGVRTGFTDQDVLQVSRALSGWTIKSGQRGPGNVNYPSNGEFVYNPLQHNTRATSVLNIDISFLTGDMVQGRRVLDLLANHPATATFIVTKLCRRIFGDNPPQSVINRGVAAWNFYRKDPHQLRRVLESIVLGDTEILTMAPRKVRRPYERLIALARTTDMVVNVSPLMTSALDGLTDGLFAWPAPNGRPDTDAYWLATGATISTWNLLLQFPGWATNVTSLTNQTPLAALTSPTQLTEYWVGRMIGHTLKPETMSALINDQAGGSGVPAATRATTNTATRVESALRRLVSLIATSEEFTYR